MREESLLTPGRFPQIRGAEGKYGSKKGLTNAAGMQCVSAALIDTFRPIMKRLFLRWGTGSSPGMKEVTDLIEEWREIRQGDVFFARISEETRGSIQAGIRPVVVISADWLNRNSTVFWVAELTTKLKNIHMKTHYVLPMIPGLPRRSMVMGECNAQLIREDFLQYRCTLSKDLYKHVDRAVRCGMRKRNRHKQKKNRKRPGIKFRGKKGKR